MLRRWTSLAFISCCLSGTALAAPCDYKEDEYRKVFDPPSAPEIFVVDTPTSLEEGAILVEVRTSVLFEMWQVEEAIAGFMPGFNLVEAGSMLDVWANGEERRACGPSDWLNLTVCFADRDKDGTLETYLELRSKQSGRVYVDKKLRRLPELRKVAATAQQASTSKSVNLAPEAIVRIHISNLSQESFDLALTSTLTSGLQQSKQAPQADTENTVRTITVSRAEAGVVSLGGYRFSYSPLVIEAVEGSFSGPFLELSCDATVLTLGREHASMRRTF